MINRIHLSPPDMGDLERELLIDAYDSNWIAPLGPHVDAFERELAEATGARYAVALSSGTAALHFALVLLGVGRGRQVLVPTLTFIAPAAAVTYVGAEPVFIDSTWASWNIDPELVEAELAYQASIGRMPAALITVDLYGQCADYERLLAVCAKYGLPVVEDAAEALGATYGGGRAGTFGSLGVFSFNGNKILTTSGGGMLMTDRKDLAERARRLATQARDPVLHYEHKEVGYNYRMSNLLAAVGRGQLQRLDEKIERRRQINRMYRDRFANQRGLAVMPEASNCRSTFWLTVVLVDPAEFGADRDAVISALEAKNIESRPAWKPMHRQPAFAGQRVVGGSVADTIFKQGVCLPSGSGMTNAEVDYVADALLSVRSTIPTAIK